MKSSWMDTVLRKQSQPSPIPHQVSASTAGATVSETTAPGQADLVRLAAPPSAPGSSRQGFNYNHTRNYSEAAPAYCSSLSGATRQVSRAECALGRRYEGEVQALTDRVEVFAAELRESKRRSEEQHAESIRRQELQMTVMQGLIDSALKENRREHVEGYGMQLESRRAVPFRREYPGEAQVSASYPPRSSGGESATSSLSAGSLSRGLLRQSNKTHNVSRYTPTSGGPCRTRSKEPMSSLWAPPATPDVRGARETRGEGPIVQHERMQHQSSRWTPINALIHTQNPNVGEFPSSNVNPLEDDIECEDDEEDEDDDGSFCDSRTEPTYESSPPPQHLPKPRYSIPRQTYRRRARGPPGHRFVYTRMPRTVLGVWNQWKHGTDGNRAIEALEREYGTAWRTGTNREIKYGSNYVGTRHRIVQYIEMRCRVEGEAPEVLCRRLDEHVDRRIQQLLSAIKKEQDPFVVIEKRC